MKPIHDVPKVNKTSYTIYNPYYKEKSEMTKSAYKPFLLQLLFRLTKSAYNYSLFWSPQKLLSLLGASSHYIIKVMNPLYDMPDTGKHWFAIYHPYYKKKSKIIEFTYNFFLLQPLLKLLLLSGDWSNNVIKYGIYYLHYNDKVAANPTRTFSLYFLCNFGNLLTTYSIFTGNSKVYNTKPDLVT